MQFQRKVLAAKTICIPLLLVASLALSCISFAQNRRHDRYSFACNSHHFMLEDFEKEPVVHSPNGRNTVQLTKDYKVRVATSGAKGCSCSYCPSLMPTSRSTGRLIPVSFSSRTATVPVSGLSRTPVPRGRKFWARAGCRKLWLSNSKRSTVASLAATTCFSLAGQRIQAAPFSSPKFSQPETVVRNGTVSRIPCQCQRCGGSANVRREGHHSN